MRLVATIAFTLIKLACALAILALGWIIFSPGTTAGWPLAHTLAPLISTLIAVFPVERIGWGVLVLALGAASVLAALPMKAVARSRGRTTPRLHPVAHEIAPSLEEAAVVEAQPVLVAVAQAETANQPHSAVTADQASARPPWEFPAVDDAVATPVDVHSVERAQPTLAPTDESQPAAAPDADPIGSHQDAIAQARTALTDRPSVETRSHFADLLKKSGDIEESEGRLGPAIEAYEHSLSLRREVVAEQPDDAREARWLWMTLETLAECRDDRGHHTQAAALYREGLAAGERAVVLAPNDAQYAQDLATTRARLAELEVQTTA